MKKQLLLLVMMLLPMVASAHDIAVANADGVWIYYNYSNDGNELTVTFQGWNYSAYTNEYSGWVRIPDEVTYNGKTLKVTSIGENTFRGGSSSLSLFVIIPNSVTSIGKYAFYERSGLKSVTIPNSVTTIGKEAFYRCSGLTSVTIPNSVTSIESRTFYGCSGLTSVTIPNSVTSIDESAFYNCSGLTSVTIPNSVTSIGEHAFSGCSRLEKVIVKDIASWCNISFFDFETNPLRYAHHLYNDEGTEITELVIPNSVTSIGENAFAYCFGLTSVIIPNSVTNIGDRAFIGCSGLTSVIIPNSITKIGHQVFLDCSGLTSITIPNSVKSISIGAFDGCSGLTSVTIPNSVTSIGDEAFRECTGLTSVHISSIEAWCKISFKDNPLNYAKHLYLEEEEIKDLVIPNSVTSIRYLTFYNCKSLTSVTIPNSVTSIGGWAFRKCSGLTSVTIGNSVTSIGEYAFDGCTSLNDVYCYANAVPTGSSIFYDTPINNSTLHVPAGSIDAYKRTSPWDGFGNIVALADDDPNPSGIDKIEASYKTNKEVFFDLNGVRLSEPRKGINIINGKKIIVK